jgi:hypothetical protein
MILKIALLVLLMCWGLGFYPITHINSLNLLLIMAASFGVGGVLGIAIELFARQRGDE